MYRFCGGHIARESLLLLDCFFTHTTLLWRFFWVSWYCPNTILMTWWWVYLLRLHNLTEFFSACSFLSTSLFIITLVYCCLLSFSSSCRAIDISLDPLSESPIIETGGVISRSARRTPSGKVVKGSAGRNYRRFFNYLATLDTPLQLLE